MIAFSVDAVQKQPGLWPLILPPHYMDSIGELQDRFRGKSGLFLCLTLCVFVYIVILSDGYVQCMFLYLHARMYEIRVQSCERASVLWMGSVLRAKSLSPFTV